ncbi:MAG: hypothetical protein K0Q57_438 [Gammaproteobacteria bacterium]|jgi:uncharacterized protein (DUF927 family)|nr:hypothetical protein [Gammaproteobacteria bacterium]
MAYSPKMKNPALTGKLGHSDSQQFNNSFSRGYVASNPQTISAEDIARGLSKCRQSGKGWIACCPAHEDHNPSLSITENDGKVLVHCQAGCSQEFVISALKDQGLWPEKVYKPKPVRPLVSLGEDDWAQLSFVPDDASPPPIPENATYIHPYKDKHGRLYGYCYRVEGTEKVIRYLAYCVNKHGKTAWRVQGFIEPRLLYGINKLKPHHTVVLIVEGEKAADAAQSLLDELDIPVLTWPNGAQSAKKADWSSIKGFDVLIWPDADEPGLVAANEIAALLLPYNKVQLINPPANVSKGWDLADAKAEGWTLQQIQECLQQRSHLVPICKIDGKLVYGRYKKGIYYHTNDQPNDEKWLCSFIEVVSQTRNEHSNAWGYWLRWLDADFKSHEWVMPASLLGNESKEWLSRLLEGGLKISPSAQAKRMLAAFIQANRNQERALCVSQSGWNHESYVLPGKTIQQGKSKVVLQSPLELEPFEAKGSIDEWRGHLSKLCIGNPLLMFAVSAAFAAPLLKVIELESGGFHFVGSSSIGKTTLLTIANSVWAKPENIKTWRATANGLESVCSQHNDNLLCLDELGQLDAKESGECAYLLANGQGKARSSKDGTLRLTNKWRLIFLSSGEIPLSEHIRQSGKKVKAGQLVRVVDLSASTGSFGIYHDIKTYDGGAVFSEHIHKLSRAYYGVAGEAYLNELIRHQSKWRKEIESYLDGFKVHVPQGADGQVSRVANRFALVAAAGAIASEMGITGWQSIDAVEASLKLFNSWLKERGHLGQFEKREVLRQVRSYLEQYANVRFVDWLNPDDRLNERLGFKRKDEQGHYTFYIFPDAINKIIEGNNRKQALQILVEAGWLQQDSQGKNSCSLNLPGIGNRRVYVILSKALMDSLE